MWPTIFKESSAGNRHGHFLATPLSVGTVKLYQNICIEKFENGLCAFPPSLSVVEQSRISFKITLARNGRKDQLNQSVLRLPNYSSELVKGSKLESHLHKFCAVHVVSNFIRARHVFVRSNRCKIFKTRTKTNTRARS